MRTTTINAAIPVFISHLGNDEWLPFDDVGAVVCCPVLLAPPWLPVLGVDGLVCLVGWCVDIRASTFCIDHYSDRRLRAEVMEVVRTLAFAG